MQPQEHVKSDCLQGRNPKNLVKEVQEELINRLSDRGAALVFWKVGNAVMCGAEPRG